MFELLVISGKGGTGKTSLVAALAMLAKNKVLVDCDVDAPDLHLLLHPEEESSNEFWGGYKASIDIERCTRCGLCEEACRFEAIKDFRVDPIFCEGCGVCFRLCPVGAIKFRQLMVGYWYISRTNFGPLVHARLGVGEENSGKLVTVIRQAARNLAREKGLSLIIIDGPPGIGCPVISSLTGVSLALVVTEPTVAGKHDLERVITLASHFRVPIVIAINKFDLALEKSEEIEEYCAQQGLEIAGKIPFDEEVNQALSRGQSFLTNKYSKAARAVTSLWEKLQVRLGS
ncbi:MinD superfamily P-loop ATPase, contains an inserted ferredoxin domain [Thermanaeromonas toyohensis ToBE]|uniref:MinD superfamily P-loop ATPase, contains an inserted ferredoxin domain n=1 Tax=Thermanaeromonas toyohensis ToBE TaxID=698762 RepID=A0A1W1W1Y7_9FIRM|nr:ATP-binding protein [Thermanaeromonas toyohensis]SMB99639.1 MinD superfamily P-loop ATPase, contains an inserted ferredoxin domain [Thermanaeromonas toyohensis ToBE]